MRERLNERALQAADLLIARNVAAVRAAVAEVELAEPACALCLMPTHYSEMTEQEKETEGAGLYSVGAFGVQIPSRRARAVASADQLLDTRVRAWFMDEFEVQYEPVPNLRDDEFRAAEMVLFHEVPEPDSEDFEGERYRPWEIHDYEWVLAEVCRHLAADPPLAPITDDFVVFYQDSDFQPEIEDLLPAIAQPGPVQLLKERGLLGEPLSDPFEEGKDA